MAIGSCCSRPTGLAADNEHSRDRGQRHRRGARRPRRRQSEPRRSKRMRPPPEETSSKQRGARSKRSVNALKDKLAGKGTVETGGLFAQSRVCREQQPRQKTRHHRLYRAKYHHGRDHRTARLLGALIDGAISAGANRINYLNFGLRRMTPRRAREAIAPRSKDAQAQAQALAASLGVKLEAY